ncbi:hypothetical protein C8R45DRAFT_1003186 [Mycena sanguinolenta]|nr:hypothetical protein C8R45DRAFT_1003186 [Mycena sanguinolenta]
MASCIMHGTLRFFLDSSLRRVQGCPEGQLYCILQLQYRLCPRSDRSCMGDTVSLLGIAYDATCPSDSLLTPPRPCLVRISSNSPTPFHPNSSLQLNSTLDAFSGARSPTLAPADAAWRPSDHERAALRTRSAALDVCKRRIAHRTRRGSFARDRRMLQRGYFSSVDAHVVSQRQSFDGSPNLRELRIPYQIKDILSLRRLKELIYSASGRLCARRPTFRGRQSPTRLFCMTRKARLCLLRIARRRADYTEETAVVGTVVPGRQLQLYCDLPECSCALHGSLVKVRTDG